MRNWLLNRRIPNGMYGGVRGRETNLVSHLLDRVLAPMFTIENFIFQK